MEYREIQDDPDGLRIRVPVDHGYRAYGKCAGDSESDPSFGPDESGVWIGFVCPEKGTNSVIDPFEYLC